MHAPLVEASGLELRLGRRPALSGIDLRVGAGEVHGLLGPGGSGKSLLLSVLASELVPSAGLVRCGPAVLVGGAALTPVAVALALASGPEVVLVDEPPAGFDETTAAAAWALVQRHTRSGGAAVWATRRLDALHGIASSVTLLAGGCARYAGSVDALVLRALAGSAEDLADRLTHAA